MTEVIVPLIALAVVVALSVWYTAGILKALMDITSMLVDSHHLIDRVHEREARYRKELEDRLMARDFDHYKAYELADTTVGGVEEVTAEERRAERPWVQGPAEPEDTPEDILEEIEALERS